MGDKSEELEQDEEKEEDAVEHVEYWTATEKNLFFKALNRFGKTNSLAISKFVGSKTKLQVSQYIERYETLASSLPKASDLGKEAKEILNEDDETKLKRKKILNRALERISHSALIRRTKYISDQQQQQEQEQQQLSCDSSHLSQLYYLKQILLFVSKNGATLRKDNEAVLCEMHKFMEQSVSKVVFFATLFATERQRHQFFNTDHITITARDVKKALQLVTRTT